MKKGLATTVLWIYVGCLGCQRQSQPVAISTAQQPSNRCPDKPDNVLESRNVKSVEFVNETATVSGQLQLGENMGYKFKGEAGQSLNFKTAEDVCIWIYTQTNEILADLKLPQTGQYIAQIATHKGTQTFSLQMTLGDSAPISEKQVSTEGPEAKPSAFAKTEFPKAACGDSQPVSLSAYPVTFYPVQAPNTEANLNTGRSKFYADAYVRVAVKTGEKVVQVASFIDQKDAKEFLDLISPEIKGAFIGLPKTYNSIQ